MPGLTIYTTQETNLQLFEDRKPIALFDLRGKGWDNGHVNQYGKSKWSLVLRAGALVLLVALLAGVGTSGAENKGKMSATVVSRVRHWLQTGEASWYGLKFQGHKTATGERYDMAALTCAHRTLPLGSWIRVTNLRNRKSVFVRVNDRGPMSDDRIIDLSYAAAQAVGLRGVDKVKLEGVSPENAEMSRALVAQVGAHELSLMPNR